MTALIPFVLFALIILVIVIWGISYITMIPPNVRNVIIGCIILLFAYVLAMKAGVL